MKKYINVFISIILLISCSGSDDGGEEPSPKVEPSPSLTAATLIFPDNNLECNEGINITETESTVEFKWEESSTVDTYEVVVTDLVNGTVINTSTSDTKINITLNRATPYSWFVISNSLTDEAKSETWRFYNSGRGVTSYAPFPATIISPEIGAKVIVNEASNITLTWDSADVDNDLTSYKLYVGISLDSISFVADIDNPENTSYNLDITKGNRYYWQIISIDEKGNQSESSTGSFYVNP